MENRAVFFDLWDTLVYHTNPVFERVMKVLEIKDEKIFWQYFTQKWLLDSGTPLRDFARGMCSEFQVPYGRAEEIARLFEEDSKNVALYEDSVDVLKMLKGKYRIGLVSNSGKMTREILRSLEIYGYFDKIILSCEIGSVKPEEKIYKIALAELDASARTSYVIGNNPREDLKTAKRIRMNTILIAREKTSVKYDFVDFTVSSLAEVPNKISRI